jgi:hypothetical protein
MESIIIAGGVVAIAVAGMANLASQPSAQELKARYTLCQDMSEFVYKNTPNRNPAPELFLKCYHNGPSSILPKTNFQ